MKRGGSGCHHHYYLSKCVVACNVYISAGNQLYSQALLKILEDTQNYCLKQQQEHHQQQHRCIVVHAYADQPYNRSSIHLAGTPKLVSNVASFLATNAIQTLKSSIKEAESTNTNTITTLTDHPTVGLVDHVSILPLTTTSSGSNSEFDDDNNNNRQPKITKEQWYDYCKGDNPSSSTTTTTITPDTPTLPTGWVAREIGIVLKKLGVDVLLYGYAHQDTNTPLATIRRERTNFFKESSKASTSSFHPFVIGQQATVGAPTYFVENYNIRFKSNEEKKIAMDLTKHLREKDGGSKFVEALTLPYSKNRYETACNLLNPDITSSKDIDEKIKEWIKKHNQEGFRGSVEVCDEANNPIEIAYRVGTTASQCLDALQQTSTPTSLEEYNSRTLDRFRKYLL